MLGFDFCWTARKGQKINGYFLGMSISKVFVGKSLMVILLRSTRYLYALLARELNQNFEYSCLSKSARERTVDIFGRKQVFLSLYTYATVSRETQCSDESL